MYSKQEAQKIVSENIGSIEHLCKEAVCTADINLMLALGFPEEASNKICAIIRKGASELGVTDLDRAYRESIEKGRSNIINALVRRFHKLYFATRANLHPLDVLEHISCAKNEDLCACLFGMSMGKADVMKEKRRVVYEKRREKFRGVEKMRTILLRKRLVMKKVGE